MVIVHFQIVIDESFHVFRILLFELSSSAKNYYVSKRMRHSKILCRPSWQAGQRSDESEQQAAAGNQETPPTTY
jgi:hypothetical protein